MRVAEKFTDVNLFSEIAKRHTFLWYNCLSYEHMNVLYLNKHGDRTLSKTGRNLTVSDLGIILSDMFSEKWNGIYQTCLEKFPVLANYVEKVTETTTENGNSTNDTTETTVEKVSAYNDDDFVNDEQSSNTNNMKMTNENTIEKTVEKTVTENEIKMRENAIKYLQNYLIYDIIFSDINSVITLNIFE